MAGSIHVLGVRHHGPGSARAVVRALDAINPDAVLIEGPPDADALLALADHADMRPPVALLIYEPDEPRHACYYPFAEFSPEWQAMRWGLSHAVTTKFIDLPQSLRTRGDEETEHEPGEPAAATTPEQDPDANPAAAYPADPLNALAHAAGYPDGEAWWGRLIEERRDDGDPMGVFDAVREAMASAREQLGGHPHKPDRDESAREAHMRRAIRAAIKDGAERVVVICGAWHAPVLTEDALKATTAKSDNNLLTGLPKRKTAATWIPWTYERLSFRSGYGAGIESPGWYEHLWHHHTDIAEHWMTRVARLMREEQLDASPAAVIEGVRLAESLATIRGRSFPSLDELGESTLAVLCHGNPLPMRVIERKLIVGHRLGSVPDEAPAVPLQKDLAAQQKSLRLKVSEEEALLDLDQRKDSDLARSRLLHRLALLNIPWGELQEDQRRRTSTFHEIWTLQWRPELAVAVLDAARWGNTVEDAARGYLADRVRRTSNLGELTALLDHAMLADLPASVAGLVRRIADLAAVGADLAQLLDAIPPLARILRYGDVAGMAARICAGLLPACSSLDDDAASAMTARIGAVNNALTTIDNADLLALWREKLTSLADTNLHGLLCGRSARLLLDADPDHAPDAINRLSLALSPGNPPAQAAAWLEGFLGGSGSILVHDARLLGIVDQWVVALPRDTFEEVCPVARRTFSTFTPPERRMIGQSVRRSTSPDAPAAATTLNAYDPARGALVDPVLRIILGDLP
ncbi:DUF5682 family protein [Nodularia spumigena]|uniref:DUF5682 family protein n=1 Tax=Nodularia spumigena TaxID=70799 RepID=UPI002B201CC2|nr:DUF5682 family protein [Nodularia spumigena]MEA5612400.1 DUF5682 family protein [Nodularia spumigena UHCC 0040]